MTFINASDSIGALIVHSVTNVTGSLFLSLITIIIFLLAVCLIFNIPIEISIPIISPLLIVSFAYSGEFMTVLGVTLIYFSIIFVRLFFGNK